MDINSAYNVAEPTLISIGPDGIRQIASGEEQVTDLLLLPEYAPLALNTVLKALPRKANSAMLGRYPYHWGDEMVMVGIDDASYSRIIRAVQQHYQQAAPACGLLIRYTKKQQAVNECLVTCWQDARALALVWCAVSRGAPSTDGVTARVYREAGSNKDGALLPPSPTRELPGYRGIPMYPMVVGYSHNGTGRVVRVYFPSPAIRDVYINAINKTA